MVNYVLSFTPLKGVLLNNFPRESDGISRGARKLEQTPRLLKHKGKRNTVAYWCRNYEKISVTGNEKHR